MDAKWTSTTPAVAVATLGDDSAKRAIEIDAFGGASMEEVVALFQGANPQLQALGNVSGMVSFSVEQSNTDIPTLMSYLKAEYGRLNQIGSLVFTTGAGTWTFAGAVCTGVAYQPRERGAWGVRSRVQYKFRVTTLA